MAAAIAFARLLNEARPDSSLARFPWRQAFWGSLTVGAAVLFCWAMRDLITPFVIAFFFASLLDPVVTRLQQKGWPRGRIISLGMLLIVLFLVLAVWMLAPLAWAQLEDLSSKAPEYTQKFTEWSDSLYTQHAQQLKAVGIKENPLSARSTVMTQAVTKTLDGVRASLLAAVGQVLWIVIIPLSMIYFLMDYRALRSKLISFVPNHARANADQITRDIVEIFSAYVRSLVRVCVLYGIAAFCIYLLFGLKFTVFLGVAAGVLYAVPYVGPVVAIGGAVMIKIATGGQEALGSAIALAVVFLLMHFTFDYVITPRVVGGALKLHPVVNIFSLMCGAKLFGIWGMVLAMPVAASVQMILVYFFPILSAQTIGDVPDEPVITSTAQAGIRLAERSMEGR